MAGLVSQFKFIQEAKPLLLWKSIACSECVSVTLVIQHAEHMHHIILSSVACLAPPHFSTLFHTWHDFQKNSIERKMCAFVISKTSMRNISHFKNNSARCYYSCKNVLI